MLLERLKKINVRNTLVFVFLSWFIITFLVYPNINILVKIFWVDGSFNFSSFERLTKSTRAMKSLRNSFLLAFSLLITTNIIGVLTVLLVDYFDLKGRKFLKAVYSIPLVYGGIMVVSGYSLAYGPNGVITDLLTSVFPTLNTAWFSGYWGVLFIMTFTCTSNHILFLSKAVKGIDNQSIEAAKTMGASPMRIFRTIVIPSVKPTLFAISSLLFLTGLSATSAPLLVGGQDFQTINPMIITFSQTTKSRDLAALLSIILGLATFIVLFVFNRNESKTLYSAGAKASMKLQRTKINNKTLNILMHVLAYGVAVIYLLPLAVSVIFSFMESKVIATGKISLSSFTLKNYISVFTDASAAKPFIISFVYALVSSVVAVVVVVLAIRYIMKRKNKISKVFENALLIPMLLPATLIALALMLSFDSKNVLLFNKILIGTPYILLIAYVIVMLPFTLRMIKSSFFGIDKSLEEASLTLGASSAYSFFKIILPMVLPVILSVIALNFNGRLADFDITVLLYHPLLKPLGIMIRSAVQSETASLDEQALVYVYSVILMLFAIITIKLTKRKGVE